MLVYRNTRNLCYCSTPEPVDTFLLSNDGGEFIRGRLCRTEPRNGFVGGDFDGGRSILGRRWVWTLQSCDFLGQAVDMG